MTTEDVRLPFPGLRAFNRDESDLFFGRDGAVNEMVDKLAETRFLAVVGASGTGKSSLVRTGLLDGLELGLHPAGSDWAFAIMTPGGQPLGNLACALCQVTDPDGGHVDRHDDPFGPAALLEGRLRRGPQGLVEWRAEVALDAEMNVLILVDQFEELFRFATYADREDAEAFVNLLVAAVEDASSRIQVVITMRSEFLGACALIPGLAERLNHGAYLTPRMTREECRKAIIGPARLVGAEIESALVTRLLNDIASFAPWEGGDSDHLRTLARRADQLPVMQHLLNRLWSHASAGGDGRVTVRLEDYETLGGLGGALDAHGADVLAGIDPDRRLVVERIFRALVVGTTVADAIRRPLALNDLADEVGEPLDTVAALVDRFRANDCNFLRPSPPLPIHPDTVIDISHESLIRQWSTLSDWVMEEARAARYWRRLENAAERYVAGEDELLSGLALQNLLQWWKDAALGPHWAKRYAKDYDKTIRYLEESERAEVAREDAKTARARHERRRLQKWLAGVSVLALVASASAGWGWVQQEAAGEAWRKAAELSEKFGTDLVARLDGDVRTEWGTTHDLIGNMEEVMDELSSGGERGRRALAEPRALFYLRSVKTLLARGSYGESYYYAQDLHRILEAQSKAWTPPDPLANDMDLAIAESARRNGRFDDARAHLDRVADRLEASSLHDADWYASTAELLSERVALHKQKWFVSQQLGHFDELVRHTDAALTWLSDPQPPDTSEAVQHDAIRRIASAAAEGAFATVPVLFFAGVEARGRPQAEEMVQYGKRLVDEVSEIDGGDDVSFRKLEARWQLIRAWFENNFVDDDQAALNYSDNAVFALEKLAAEDSGNLETRALLAEALVRRAEYAVALGNTNRAAADIAAARALIHALRTTVADPTITFWPAGLLFWSETRLHESEGDDQAYLAAAERFLAWVQYNLGTDHAELVRALRGRIMGAWVALRSFDGDARSPLDLRDIIDFALENFDERDLAADDRYMVVRDRGYIFRRIFELGPSRLGEEHWLRWTQEGIDEAEHLIQENGTAENIMNLVNLLIGRERGRLEELGSEFSEGIPREVVERLQLAVKQRSLDASDFNDLLYYVWHVINLVDSHSSFDRHLPMLQAIADMLVAESLTEQWSDEDNSRNVSFLVTALKAVTNSLTPSDETEDNPAVRETVTALETLITHILAAKEVEVDATAAEDASEQGPQLVEESPFTEGAKESQNLRELGSRDAGWAFGPVYDGGWRTLEGSEFEEAKDTLAGALPEQELNAVHYIRQVYLPFYENGRLLDVQYSGVRSDGGQQTSFTGLKSFIVNNAGVFELNGTSPPIHNANAKGPLHLEDAQTVAAYIRFFTTFVNGEDGAFQIVEHTDDIAWKATASPSQVASAAAAVRPLVVWPSEEEPGAWRATAAVHYASHILHSGFLVRPGGMMEMVEDQPVTGELSTRVLRIADRAQGRGPRTFGLSVGDGDEDSSMGAVNLASLGVHPIPTFDEEVRQALIRSYEMPPESGAALRDEYLAQLDHDSVIKAICTCTLPSIVSVLASHAQTQQTTSVAVRALEALEQRAQDDDVPPERRAAILGSVSFNSVFVKRFDEARVAAENALALDSSQRWIETNLAHALMFLGEIEAADALYLGNRGLKVHDGQVLWEDAVLDDFKKLREVGLHHPHMAKVESALRGVAVRPAPPASTDE
jgi:hypothetical protein